MFDVRGLLFDVAREHAVAYLRPEGERVRITCTRFSELKKYSSPLSLLVGPDKDGKWLIFEEISKSQP